jgi:starvation-inducible outer membrane lipoprotein
VSAPAVIILSCLWLGGCVTCTQQVQQRESQAGKMEDVRDIDSERDEQTRETEVDLKVPVH